MDKLLVPVEIPIWKQQNQTLTGEFTEKDIGGEGSTHEKGDRW